MAERKDRRAVVDELLKKIEEGTKAVYESDRYKDMLTCMAKFHHYSTNNMIMIMLQRPDATLVCGYKGWEEKFNRHVKRGEKGIQILGYAPRTITEKQQQVDKLGFPVWDNQGNPVMEEVKTKVPAFKAMYVFDVSQTEGEPLPTIYNGALEGSVPKYELFQKALVELSPVPIAVEKFPSEAMGYFDHKEQKIVVQEGLSELQTLKTLVHEIAHAQMHNLKQDDPDYVLLDRETKEIEAESVAYVICTRFSLDTSDYSFPYIAGWAGDKELKVLHSSLDRIRERAIENITFLEQHLEQALTAEQPKNTFTIYQVKQELRDLRFMDMSWMACHHKHIEQSNYDSVYTAPLEQTDSVIPFLENLYMRFNLNKKPEGYTGHSLSVSDVIVLHQDGVDTAYFCDSVGFVEVPQFLQPPVKEQKPLSLAERLSAMRRTAQTKVAPQEKTEVQTATQTL